MQGHISYVKSISDREGEENSYFIVYFVLFEFFKRDVFVCCLYEKTLKKS